MPTANTQTVNIEDEMKQSYLAYSMSVIVGRALPNAKDGLKPVHRRAFYGMYELGALHNRPYKKSARIAGDVIGKYHPHGEGSVYLAFARFAQPWNMRYCLVDGQGNFGSVDGDPCFTGDTRVQLVDGRTLSFLELIEEAKRGKKNYTYTFNHKTSKIEIAEITNIRKTKENTKIAKVYLDNGEVIKCTYNEKFLTREGTYAEARQLGTGASLMPCYRRLTTKETRRIVGYEEVFQPTLGYWDYTHHLADEWNLRRGVYSKKVELTNERADVYDCEIAETHNFALAAGVFVHNCAAMRYTEARLSKLGELLLRDIDKDTVDLDPNYDGSLQEPAVLPSVLPNLLLNGSEGIAVGMATSIPPHNLTELLDGTIYLIKHENAELPELMQFIKGPDFPTGGFICGTEGIVQGYKTGRGKIKVRAKTHFEKLGGKDVIVADEIPYQINKATLITKIAQLVRDKELEGISDLRDESDKEGTRIVVELKRDANPEVVLNNLFEKTDFESGFSLNCLAIVDNFPQVLTLKQALEIFISHRRAVVTRRTKFDLKRAQEKEHVLLGLKIVTENTDQIVELIRKSKNSDEAKTVLQGHFALTDTQVKAVLELQLRRLVVLESTKILQDLTETQAAIKGYKDILDSSSRLDDEIIKELEEIKKEFGDERKTKIIGDTNSITTKDLIADEQMVITISHVGYAKRSSVSLYKAQSRAGRGKTASGVKDEDFVEHMFVSSTHDILLVFTNQGRAYALNVFEIPEASRTAKGKALVNLISFKPDEKIATVLAVQDFTPGKFVFFVTKNGIVKKTALTDFERIRTSGLTAITIEEGDKLIGATVTDDEQQIVLATKQGMMARFAEKNIRPSGRGAIGVIGIRLDEGDEVVGFATSFDSIGVELLVVSSKGYGKRTPLEDYRLINRGGKGVTGVRVTDKNGPVVGLLQVGGGEDVMLITNSGTLIRLKAADIRSCGRATVGVKLIAMADGELLSSVTKVPEEDLEGEVEEPKEKLTLFEEKK